MWNARKVLISSCLAFAVSSCGDDALSPNREQAAADGVAGARAAVNTMSAWPVNASRIDMSWPDNSRNETGWEVHRSTTGAGGTFTLLASLPVNSTFHSNTGLAAHTEYCYQARSFRQSGPNTSYGAFTSVACATTFAPPAAPSNLSAIPPWSGTVNLAWTDNASDEQGQRLERAAAPEGPWQTAASLSPNVQSFTDNGRPVEQLVCYRVIATNGNGESPSNVDCTAPPQWPNGLSAVAGTNSITVSWTDRSAVEDGYEVSRALDDFAFAVVATLPANAASFEDATAVPDTRYWYRVRALKDGGGSSQGETVSAVLAAGPPRTPESLFASPAGSSAAQLYWTNPSPSATEFRIERSMDGVGGWVTAGTSAGEFFTDVDRVPEQRVCYRAFASNAFGESPASNVDCTVPPAAPSNVYTAPLDDGSVLVSWDDNSNVEDGYELWTVYCWVDYYYGDWYCEYFNAYQAPANATSLTFFPYEGEYFSEIYAFSDGGYSDMGTWASSSALSLVSGKSAVRPKKGARAPVPPHLLQSKPAGQRTASPRKP